MELKEATKKVEVSAEESNQEVRDCTGFVGFNVMRQGDVYIAKLDTEKDLEILAGKMTDQGGQWDRFNFGKLKETGSLQLASGSSKGSRHIIDRLKGKVLFSEGGHPCAGGLIKADAPWLLTHPEHAHAKFSKGLFAFTYQVDARKEGEIRRVAD